jgi:hypothetical protein
VKRYFLTNLTTMVMALFLSFLTWFYLFTQGNGPGDISVQFMPKLDMKNFASVTYETTDGQELSPERSLVIRALGPKGDVNSMRLRPNIFKCEFNVNPGDLAGPRGTFRRQLIREDFDLPHNIGVDPLPVITIRYVKYDERLIELIADRTTYEGTLRPGYEIESITPTPRRIRAQVPADKPGIDKVGIRSVPVDAGKTESFTLPGWYLSGLATETKIQPLDPFTVEVKIALRPASRQIHADLHVSARSDHLHRIQLDRRTVDIELRGPEDLVQEAAQNPAVFIAYIVVTDKDMEPKGPKNIGEMGCHIADPKYRGKIDVVLMPAEKPENRQVKITVLDK